MHVVIIDEKNREAASRNNKIIFVCWYFLGGDAFPRGKEGYWCSGAINGKLHQCVLYFLVCMMVAEESGCLVRRFK